MPTDMNLEYAPFHHHSPASVPSHLHTMHHHQQHQGHQSMHPPPRPQSSYSGNSGMVRTVTAPNFSMMQQNQGYGSGSSGMAGSLPSVRSVPNFSDSQFKVPVVPRQIMKTPSSNGLHHYLTTNRHEEFSRPKKLQNRRASAPERGSTKKSVLPPSPPVIQEYDDPIQEQIARNERIAEKLSPIARFKAAQEQQRKIRAKRDNQRRKFSLLMGLPQAKNTFPATLVPPPLPPVQPKRNHSGVGMLQLDLD